MQAIPLELDDAEASPAASSLSERLRTRWFAAPILVRVMFTLDVAMGVIYFVSRRCRNVLPRPVLDFLDLNGETNLPSWYSAAQLALIGGLLITFAMIELRRGVRTAWAVMLGGVGFCFLSLDETAGLHEQFGYWLDHIQARRGTSLHETGWWMFICAPLFLAGVAFVGYAARHYLRGRAGVVVKFAIGAMVLVGAGAGVEMLSNFVIPHGAAARALVLVEEIGEMIGATTMLWAVLDLLSAHGLRLMVTTEEPRRASHA
jgi:hypothetical protein